MSDEEVKDIAFGAAIGGFFVGACFATALLVAFW